MSNRVQAVEKALLTRILFVLALVMLSSVPSLAAQEAGEGLTVLMPDLDPQRGRQLFVSKGCVVCHSVNGVGGKAAVALDAPNDAREVDIADFAARLWRSAFAMAELQAVEFSYQIELTGDELADLAAFASDIETQRQFSEGEIPEETRQWILDEPFFVDDPVFGDD